MSFVLHGIGVSRGIAIGRAVCLDAGHEDITHHTIPLFERGLEQDRFAEAIAVVRAEFEHLKRHVPAGAPPELRALLDVHAMILDDPALTSQSLSLIADRGMNAEWALAETADELAAQFDAMDDPYLRERKHDVLQVVSRVRRALAGADMAARRRARGDGEQILVASDLSPADMLQYRHDDPLRPPIAAFCTEFGGRTSHTAILARSMGVPAVVGIADALERIVDDDWIIVDGNAGVIVVAPDAVVLDHYRARVAAQARERAALASIASRQAITQDGRRVHLLANIELPEDAALARAAHAEGVGLFRSEFLFMNRAELPSEEEQFEAYRAAIVGMGGQPVTIRTLDIGADKTLQTEEARDEHAAENPALGLRAIRYSLAEPTMFRTQLRAMLRASAFGPLRILIPMLSSAAEIDAALAHISQVRAELSERGIAMAAHVPVGGMIEVPAAALAIGAFTKRLDFLSIGTNDLIQYTLAIDRADSAVAELYEPLHPAVLMLVAQTIRAGTQAGCEVSVCGEMAGDAQLTELLLGMGLTQFSMHPVQIPYVKSVILDSDYRRAHTLAQTVLTETDARDIRALLTHHERQTRTLQSTHASACPSPAL